MVEREFIMLGEALKLMAQRDPQLFAMIPGSRQMIDFRSLLTHEHLNVNVQVVWGDIQMDLSVLSEKRMKLLLKLDRMHASAMAAPTVLRQHLVGSRPSKATRLC